MSSFHPVSARSIRIHLLVSSLVLATLTGCLSPYPPRIRHAIKLAGDNRNELKQVLRHYQRQDNPKKLAAAEFLLANMEGKGYVVATFFDKDKNEVEFDALDYPDFASARQAMETLEKEHGELHYGRKRFDKDLETITADFMIENIDLAFQAWRTKPWARDLTFDAFCETVLPYRGSNEPINSTRPFMLERYADLPRQLEDPTDAQEAARLIQKDVGKLVGFSELYYLHPTDQSFEEMCARRLGRCEDITNMQMYAMRAQAIASASDYTPFWADRDNNHAWQVILDAQGRGKAGLFNRAAKVYRKTFSLQPDSLGAIKRENEKVPRWLSGKNYIDVTDQYLETTDVELKLEVPAPDSARFVYICVFNGGQWQPIHWAPIDAGRATFTNMGRNIAYLAAYYVDEELKSAAPPFILSKQGEMRFLRPAADRPLTVELTATAPTTPDIDTRIARPMIVVKPGKAYELFAWEDGWQSQGKQAAGDEPVSFEAVPGGALYWLVEEDSQRLERIFTLEDGKQVWW